MVSILEFESVSKVFGAQAALEDLSFAMQRGEIFGYLGPNGAGKTTTIRIMLGLLKPDQGTCRVAGLDVAHSPQAVRTRCGALLDSPGHYEALSVIENLRFFGALQGLPKARLAQRMDRLLEEFGLAHKRMAPVATLSTGMKQKLGIVRSLLHDPELLILDEPTRGLDPAATIELRGMLRKLATDHNTSIFITSHNLGEMERICDRVAILREGQLLCVEPVAALTKAAGTERVQLRANSIPDQVAQGLRQASLNNNDAGEDLLSFAIDAGADLSPLVSKWVSAGLSIQEIRREGIDLEQAYLARMESCDAD